MMTYGQSVIGLTTCTALFFPLTRLGSSIDRLKPGKNDGGIGLTSDHFEFACHDLSVHIGFFSLLR
jgi:hypothetical protein